MQQSKDGASMSFWEHLDVLRAFIIRIVVVWLLCSVVAFFFKEQVFSIIMAPKDSGFITYRWLELVSRHIAGTGLSDFSVQIINTGLAQQFMLHIKASFFVGLLVSAPYAIYQVLCFILPALYDNERRGLYRAVAGGSVMFVIGLLFSYFVVFPLTFRFLGTYQVSADLQNLISIQSYIDTMLSLTLSLGIVFEVPVVCWLLAQTGLLKPRMMSRYRRHAVVVILIVAAIITPTQDVFTLLIVSLPIWLLYEASIWVVRLQTKP